MKYEVQISIPGFSWKQFDSTSPDWKTFCHEYQNKAGFTPRALSGDQVRALFWRGEMIGGFILGKSHKRYLSFIDMSDIDGIQKFQRVTLNRQLISVNCLWRKKGSHFVDRLAPLLLYANLLSLSRFSRVLILAGATAPKLQKLYQSWGPLESFSALERNGLTQKYFIFGACSGMRVTAIYLLKVLKFSFSKSKKPERISTTHL